MKEKIAEKNVEYPENPPWTMFFDGPLYQEYDKFMKTKDFSQILLNTKLRLANNSQSPEVINPVYTIHDEHWNKENDADPTGSTYHYVSEDYYQRKSEEEKRRTRRTRAFILISLVTIAALAFGTALVIHYVFIEPSDTPKNFLNISSFTNITPSDLPEITTVSTKEKQTEKKPLLLEDLLQGHGHRTHDHSTHDHSHEHNLKPVGKIFDDQFITEAVTTETPATTIKTPATTILITSSSSTSTTTMTYLLNLNPYPASGVDNKRLYTKTDSEVTTTKRVATDDKKPKKKSTSTTVTDPLDFFGMDDLPTTTQSKNTTLSDADFFAIDDFYYDTTTMSKPQTSQRPTTGIH